MFKAFGHDKVSILDGGLPAWEAMGFELDTSPLPATTTAATPGTYKCELLPNAIWDMTKVRAPHGPLFMCARIRSIHEVLARGAGTLCAAHAKTA
jgi:hypothetical protein